MLQGLSQNISLECIHLESKVLGDAVYPILRRNRRIRQVDSLLVDDAVATQRSVLGQALKRVHQEGPVVSLSPRYMIVSRLLVEDENDSYRYRVRKRRRLFEKKRRQQMKLYGDCSNSSGSAGSSN